MSAKPRGWAWVGRLAGFGGLFIAFGLLLALATAFVARMAGTEATGGIDWWGVTPPFVAALAATWLLAVRVDGRPLSALGLRGGRAGLNELGTGSLAGLALIGAVILVLALPGWVSWRAPAGANILAGVNVSILLLCAAFTEELLFRGYPFRVLQFRFGPVPAVAGTSVAFSFLHGANPGVTPLALVNIAFAGVLLGVVYWRTGSLWFATGVHFGWNWAMAASGLPVSGLAMPISGLEAVVTGPALWTGGAFGPEGALLVTFVTVLGTAWLWRIAVPRGGSGSRSPLPAGTREEDEGGLDAGV